MFPCKLRAIMHALPEPVLYAGVGGAVGLLAGASGAIVLLALLLGHPVGLFLLVGLAGHAFWRASRRHRAAGLACLFALGVGLAQWPLTAWHAGRLLGSGAGGIAGSIVFAALLGLACAPVVIATVRAPRSGASV